MSDLQIATGFAILLSGFAQLHCGLVAFKWRAILDLAWFSCLTHLVCLTMLRGYLHAHTFERLWRLFATGSLAALLAVGLLFTANSDWDRVFRLKDNAPTLCIIGCNRSRSSVGDPVSFWTPVISATFLVVAFVSRVVRLHKVLSVDTFGRASDWLDFQGRRLLWVFFRLFCTEGDVYSLKRSLAYRPLFGIFMTLRLLLDLWASFAFEVCYFGISNRFHWHITDILGLFGFSLGYLASARWFIFEQPCWGWYSSQQGRLDIRPTRVCNHVDSATHKHYWISQ